MIIFGSFKLYYLINVIVPTLNELGIQKHLMNLHFVHYMP